MASYKHRIHAFFLAFLFALVCITAMPRTTFSREMIEYPQVKLQSLDKVTARTMTFEADVGSTLRFGPLYIRVQKCKKSSPIDKPEAAAFLQIWEVDPGAEPEWVFSGWMFSSSPALSAMDHPIYDVWVLDCFDYENEQASPETPEEEAIEGSSENTETPASAETETEAESGGKTDAATGEDTLEN